MGFSVVRLSDTMTFTGERMGKQDHIASWKKPKKPTWMKQEQYDAYPDLMPVREFKVAGNVYVTTFLTPKHIQSKIWHKSIVEDGILKLI